MLGYDDVFCSYTPKFSNISSTLPSVSSMALSWIMDGLAATVTLSNVLRLLTLWMSYHFVRALYNISPWHPLSRIPGPKLAAMTLLYEFWYDFALGGTYTKVIRKMHETYGENRPTISSSSSM
jgi:hypothetical protein